MKNVAVCFLVVVSALGAAAQTASPEPSATNVTAASGEPLVMCSPKHAPGTEKCVPSCTDESRPPGSCLVRPRPVSTPDPKFTDQARRKRTQGSVLVKFTVGPDGKVVEVKLARGLEPSLDQSTIETVRRWRFEPATFEGKPVAVRLYAQVNFRRYNGTRRNP
jgi:TonB family protein